MINIVDLFIVLFIIFGGIIGFKRGVIKQGVITIGTILVLILSFLLKNPISSFMYKTMPFFNFDMIIKNATVLNILVYEIIAFLIAFSILEIILFILIKISSIIEKIIRATIILEMPSKILGLILGFIESYIIVFIILFIISQPTFSLNKIDAFKDSKLKDKILQNSFLVSKMSTKYVRTFNEISDLIEEKDSYSSKEFNCKSLIIMIDNNFLTKDSANYLYKKGKINTKCGLK